MRTRTLAACSGRTKKGERGAKRLPSFADNLDAMVSWNPLRAPLQALKRIVLAQAMRQTGFGSRDFGERLKPDPLLSASRVQDAYGPDRDEAILKR